MNLSILIYLLDTTDKICNGRDSLAPVFGILGYIFIGIKIVVPIALIIFGMMDMAKAVMGGDDKKIKEAQKSLVTKIIAAVVVFLVVTIVTFIMSIIGFTKWEECFDCVQNPTESKCTITKGLGS